MKERHWASAGDMLGDFGDERQQLDDLEVRDGLAIPIGVVRRAAAQSRLGGGYGGIG